MEVALKVKILIHCDPTISHLELYQKAPMWKDIYIYKSIYCSIICSGIKGGNILIVHQSGTDQIDKLYTLCGPLCSY